MDFRKTKQSIALILAAALLLTLIPFSGAFGATTQEKLNTAKKNRSDVGEQLAAINKRLEQKDKEIQQQQTVIQQKTAEYEATLADLEETKREQKYEEENFGKRVRAMYKLGSVGYIEILINSKSVTDLIENVDLVKKIYRNDQKQIQLLKEHRQILEKKSAVLKQQKDELTAEQEKLQTAQASMKKEQAAFQKKYNELNAETLALERQLRQAYAAKITASFTGRFIWPCRGTINAYGHFGHRNAGIGSTYHQGIDISCAYGTPIKAAAAGTVIFSGYNGGCGNYVMVAHGQGYTTEYMHCSRLVVSKGQAVSQGQVIAYVGSTGISNGPHLHFGVILNGKRVNPESYLP